MWKMIQSVSVLLFCCFCTARHEIWTKRGSLLRSKLGWNTLAKQTKFLNEEQISFPFWRHLEICAFNNFIFTFFVERTLYGGLLYQLVLKEEPPETLKLIFIFSWWKSIDTAIINKQNFLFLLVVVFFFFCTKTNNNKTEEQARTCTRDKCAELRTA